MTKPIIEMQNSVIHGLVVRQVMSYVAPLTFGIAPGTDADGERTQNASCSLLELKNQRFLITNDHVLRGFEGLRAHPRARLQIGDAEPIVPVVVDRDPERDVAVLDASGLKPEDVTERGEHISFWPIRPSRWPLGRVKKGEWVCFGGWPQAYRRGEKGDRLIVNASWSLSATEVTEVSADRFICVLDRSGWQEDINAVEGGLSTKNLGGLSGCPAFVLRDLSFEYVGVLSDYAPNYDTMMFTHTDIIRENGTIVKD